MERRDFLGFLSAAGLFAWSPQLAFAAADYGRLLVLVELKGGNDGLNTVVPYGNPRYAELRPRLAIRRDRLLQLDGRRALHPSLEPLLPMWRSGELAIVESVGYAQPNLSHFRSIEIWDTASGSPEYLHEGWLARVFARQPVPSGYIADGVLVGSSDPGPLTGARAIALSDPAQFRRQSRLAQPSQLEGNAGLRHVLKVESDVLQAATKLNATVVLKTEFPKRAFGDAVRTGCSVVAAGGIAVLRLTLSGFDTHQNQAGTHANLLRQLADGLVALRAGLVELNRWQQALVMTYSEFGRRAKENQSGGTDHGTAAPHFVLGGRVRGGFHGAPPALDRLDGNGNLPFAVDFRSLYATAIERWWTLPGNDLLGARVRPLDLVRA
ncbi:MAG: DUF1501 domain-containing protein [Dechloromonas sp.]|nr:DUF1501 domain-containing protein [Dechloromonas sp.]